MWDLLLRLGVTIAFAQNSAGGRTTILPDNGMLGRCSFLSGEIHFDCIPIFIAYLIEYIFGFIGTLSLIMIMYAGYEIALGPVANTGESGKNRLRNAIIGLIVSVMVFAIVNFIISSIT